MSVQEAHDDYGTGAEPIKARLKWFNAAKGFGFVSPVDGQSDAFLHVSVLQRAGLSDLGDRAEMVCEVGLGPKGPQVMRIVEMISHGEARPAAGEGDRGGGFHEQPRRRSFDAPAPEGPEAEMDGTVKWFKTDKGFGFITADDSEKDVFVHKSVLRRCGLMQLEAGQRVRMRVQDVEKGREATWVSPS